MFITRCMCCGCGWLWVWVSMCRVYLLLPGASSTATSSSESSSTSSSSTLAVVLFAVPFTNWAISTTLGDPSTTTRQPTLRHEELEQGVDSGAITSPRPVYPQRGAGLALALSGGRLKRQPRTEQGLGRGVVRRRGLCFAGLRLRLGTSARFCLALRRPPCRPRPALHHRRELDHLLVARRQPNRHEHGHDRPPQSLESLCLCRLEDERVRQGEEARERRAGYDSLWAGYALWWLGFSGSTPTHV